MWLDGRCLMPVSGVFLLQCFILFEHEAFAPGLMLREGGGLAVVLDKSF